MKYLLGVFCFFLSVSAIACETGVASYYDLEGKTQANGKPFHRNNLTCAHKTRKLGSYVKVTNLENGRSLVLQVTDRGPYIPGRIIDLSPAAANVLNCHLCHIRVD